MWLAIVILTMVNSAGWFLFGISVGEKGPEKIKEELAPIKPYKFPETRQLDV